MPDTGISAETLAEIQTEVNFAAAAQQAVEILTNKRDGARGDLAAAREAAELVQEQVEAAGRAERLATRRYLDALKRAGVVRDADGYRPGTPEEIAAIDPNTVGVAIFEWELDGPITTGPESAEIDAP